MLISFINVTYGNKEYIEDLISNLDQLDDCSIELIVIDQNPDFNVMDLVNKEIDFPIHFFKSDQNLLSRSRNIGIDKCNGEIICFTDDDIRYPQGFTHHLRSKFSQYPGYDFLLGRVLNFDNEPLAFVKRSKPGRVRKHHLFHLVTSVSIFFKKDGLRIIFDENLGLGAPFGSSEEIDFIHSNLEGGAKGFFLPELYVYHPVIQIFTDQNVERIRMRSLGHGAYFRKHLMIKSFLNHCILRPGLKALFFIFSMKVNLAIVYLRILYFRVLGFLKFKSANNEK